ncbi:uncharacterized protein [Littorina saxatilis]|uniref:uncharacterized protein n=1 Tax=Littorina saxatilis TaxID=31220 RepID=UPI0038B6AD1F
MADHRAEFRDFDHTKESDRLDVLLHSHLANKKQFQALWTVIRLLLLLSHGQATVERGFSVNKETSADNISELGLVARRQILNHIRQVGGVLKVDMSKELLMSASSARSRYQQFLDEEKKENEAVRAGAKRKRVEDSVSDLKLKRIRLEEEGTHLENRADQRAEDAENDAINSLSIIAESNALRRRAKEKRASVVLMQKNIDDEMKRVDSL